ncbi:Aste57867_18126 [Aphanomyces stellatus]|uniref:Aste57867_18126 protein n=1 Tax=Aphanomyces stellatus TaxID=120398 RepID=A0A485LAV8_9STRA|nr:hypothetical protein As57867_018064 [Aphanomyces stellatus]VFT94864.1 Aste57867_18126 [Aphanomyces stellatus]
MVLAIAPDNGLGAALALVCAALLLIYKPQCILWVASSLKCLLAASPSFLVPCVSAASSGHFNVVLEKHHPRVEDLQLPRRASMVSMTIVDGMLQTVLLWRRWWDADRPSVSDFVVSNLLRVFRNPTANEPTSAA